MLRVFSNLKIVFFIAGSVLLPSINKKEGGVCKTRDCIKTAYRIGSYMDTTVSPCDNFYKFACGNFLKQTQLAASESERSATTELINTVNEQLKGVLQERLKLSDARPQILLKTLYRLCINERKINYRGVQPALALLDKIGGWPVLGKWNSQNWNIFKVVLKLRELGIEDNGLFKLHIVSTPAGIKLQVGQPDLIMPREILRHGVDHPDVKIYLDFMVDIAVMFGAKEKTAREDMIKVLVFQLRIAEIVIPPDQISNPALYKLADLQVSQPWMQWQELVSGVRPPSVTTWDESTIVLSEPSYLLKVEGLFINLPDEVAANFMMWHAAFSLTDLLSSPFRVRKAAFMQKMFGVEQLPRWKQCVKIVNDDLHIALALLYVNKYLDKDTKNEVIDIAANIRKETGSILMELQWMDPQTRQIADTKATKIDLEMGFTGDLTDVSKLEQYYKQLNINGDYFFESFLDLNKWRMNQLFYEDLTSYKKYGYNPIQMNNFGKVNGYLDIVANSLRFPSNMFQPPFFNPKLPNYLNYAALGSEIGRVITHSIDHNGAHFSAEGDYQPWWTQGTWEKFILQTSCMASQYGGSRKANAHPNADAMRTLSSNIADNGGLKLAFRAYQRKMEGRKEPALPGLQKYSNQQLLLINYANMMCTAYKPAALQRVLEHASHSSAEFRVNGPILNLPGLEKIFPECKKGSPMNPDEKCGVW